jgi:hypothetical protein
MTSTPQVLVDQLIISWECGRLGGGLGTWGQVRAPNSTHSLLASGSDDQHTIVWDPLHHKKLLSMHTGHTANIFSVKVSRTNQRASERHDWAVGIVVLVCFVPGSPWGHRYFCCLSVWWWCLKPHPFSMFLFLSEPRVQLEVDLCLCEQWQRVVLSMHPRSRASASWKLCK